MAKTINVSFNGEKAVFGFRPIDRSALYGRRRRVAFDTEGNECSRASLLSDGSLLLQSGMTAQGYFLKDGTWVPQSDLTAISTDGKPLEIHSSTVGIEVELREVNPEEALSISFSNTYLLEAEEFSPKIKELLDSGKIFAFPFNVKDDYNLETGLLIGNESGYFALIGNKVEYETCTLETVASVVDESSDSSSDDLDFEMF
ncbi:MAG: hypothetical protein FJW46_06840 [Actinobacteria bacterium]|nr:hypothetical protein [Actinomycetota bacterium]